MNDTPEKIWEYCLDYVRENIGEELFEQWFTPVIFNGIQNETLSIKVPNKVVREYLEEHFGNVLRTAIRQKLGKEVSVDYILPDSTRKHSKTKEKVTSQAFDSNLNPDYTFENFIKGESNKLPLSVGLSISNNPNQTTFNPFFIFGGSGVGKTHLVYAIGDRIQKRFPEKRVYYISAHAFQVGYTNSIRTNTFNDFIRFFQQIDVLIIDDIHEFAGRAKTQQAFFHIFNHLHQNRRQLIMTCDRPPIEIEGLEERLLTRFKWGLIAEIERPCPELRRAILLNNIKRLKLDFPENVVQYIADHVENNVRDLLGIVNSIMAYSVVYDCDIDLELAERVVARSVNLNRKPLTIEEIVGKVCQHYKTSNREVMSKSRKQNIVQVRQVAMYLSQKHTGQSYARIGAAIGKRDHSTVLHSCNQVEKRISVDKVFRRELEDIESSLQENF